MLFRSFTQVESHILIEESLAKLKKDEKSSGRSGGSARKRDRSYSPRYRGSSRRTCYGDAPSTRADSQDDKTAPISVNTASTEAPVKDRLSTVRYNYARYTEYTPLTSSIEHIFEVGDKAGIFRKPVRNGPPGRKDLARYCAFHDTHGHDTADCSHLKDRIEDLIRQGLLTEFVAQEAKKYKDAKAGKENDHKNTV